MSGSLAGLPEHQLVLDRAIALLQGDPDVLGLYLSGSLAHGSPDRWSDIDLYVVVADGQVDATIAKHRELVEAVGEVATAFPATHLGDPHQLIVFYRMTEPLHVDYQYRASGELKPRRRDAAVRILLDRRGDLARWLEACRRAPDDPGLTADRLQYLETRFWAWCWYAHGKVRRGELWEARDAIEYMRGNVLVPLAHIGGIPFEGNRRLETKLPPGVHDLLMATIPARHSPEGYTQALTGLMRGYRQLYAAVPAETRARVTEVDRAFFEGAIGPPATP